MKPQIRTGARRFPLAGMLLSALLLVLSAGQIAEAQTHVTLDEESRLWIEGTSSVNSFTCAADTIEGTGTFSPEASDNREAMAEIQVPVQEFDCGKARMNKDLYNALKAEAHPQILFRLSNAELTASTLDDEIYPLRLVGQLTIAGMEQTVAMNVQGERNQDGTFRAAGSLPLLMSDFGIDPPTALFGLIKARDQITVRFDLVAAPRKGISTN